VSLIKTNRTKAGAAAIGARAKDAAAQAVPIGKRAGTTAVQGALQGATGARSGPRRTSRTPSGAPGNGSHPGSRTPRKR
jgi:hypothetical protein